MRDLRCCDFFFVKNLGFLVEDALACCDLLGVGRSSLDRLDCDPLIERIWRIGFWNFARVEA